MSSHRSGPKLNACESRLAVGALAVGGPTQHGAQSWLLRSRRTDRSRRLWLVALSLYRCCRDGGSRITAKERAMKARSTVSAGGYLRID